MGTKALSANWEVWEEDRLNAMFDRKVSGKLPYEMARRLTDNKNAGDDRPNKCFVMREVVS